MVDGGEFTGEVEGEGALPYTGPRSQYIHAPIAEPPVQGFVKFLETRWQGVRTAFVGGEVLGMCGCDGLGAPGGAGAAFVGKGACGVECG